MNGNMRDFYLLIQGRDAIDRYVIFLKENFIFSAEAMVFHLTPEQYKSAFHRYFSKEDDFVDYGNRALSLRAPSDAVMPGGSFKIMTIGGALTIKMRKPRKAKNGQ